MRSFLLHLLGPVSLTRVSWPAASVCVDPFARSARPSIRVDQLINHQLLHTSSDAEAVRRKRTNLLLDSRSGCQAHKRGRFSGRVHSCFTSGPTIEPINVHACHCSSPSPQEALLTWRGRRLTLVLPFVFGLSTSSLGGTS
jgi:hypothetical protein